jgi:hypothetical protein
MDIEGSEYDVIENILTMTTDIQVNQILIEFPDRFFENGRNKTLNSIKLLKSHGFEIFAVSSSNEEVSFINKKIL